MHCVDLGESFPTSIYLQNLASIQPSLPPPPPPPPRTSLVKIARSPRTDPQGYTMTLRLLHRLGANLNAADTYGRTPVHDASINGCTKTLRVLHALGANLNVADNSGFAPAHFASDSGTVAIVRVLGELGANLKATTNTGVTPERLARVNGDLKMVEVLEKWHIAHANWSRFFYRTFLSKIGDGAVPVVAFAFGECPCALCNLSVNDPQTEHVRLVQHAEPPAV